MGSPQLILRFRNYVNGVLGTEEHQRLIDRFGSAWWGWWKRDDEGDRSALLRELPKPFAATLISLSEEVQFIAQVREVKIGALPDLRRVPRYYRQKASEIPAWLKVVDIEPVEFDRVLAGILSRSSHTLLTPDELREIREHDPAAIWEIESDYNQILHLSDVHLGVDHNFALPGEPTSSTPDPRKSSKRISLVEAIERDLKRLKSPGIAAIIISGDLVSRCEWDHDLVLRFFSELADAMNVEKRSILFVPGNHDFYRQNERPEDLNAIKYQHEMSYRGFLAQFHGTAPLEEINRTVRIGLRRQKFDLVFGFLNSARWTSIPDFFEYGFVGKEKYRSVLDDMKRLGHRPCLRGLVLHHHLVPIQPFEQPGLPPSRPVSITLDATEIVRDAQEAGVALVLHGHQHFPDVVKISRLRRMSNGHHGLRDEDVFICSAGSCGSRELPRHEWNTYSLIEFAEDKIHCRMRMLDPEDNQAGDVINIDLPLRLINPKC